MQNDTLICKGELKDIFKINYIENNEFREQAWSLNMIADELSDEVDRMTWVIYLKGIIRGYYMIRRYVNECHLITIAIEPSYQRSGLGETLIKHLLERNPSKSSIFLEVKKSNFSAIKLYLKMGFKEIYNRKHYYQDGSSALIMNFNSKKKYGLV